MDLPDREPGKAKERDQDDAAVIQRLMSQYNLDSVQAANILPNERFVRKGGQGNHEWTLMNTNQEKTERSQGHQWRLPFLLAGKAQPIA
jgi:hypothetical protein